MKKKLTWRRVVLSIVFWASFIGLRIDGVDGMTTAWLYCAWIVIIAWLLLTIWDFIWRVFWAPREITVHHVIHTAEDGLPDIEGTATRHPDPTRPDPDWDGTITERIQK